METSTFGLWMKSLDANPRFYDRCLTACTVLLVLMLAAVVYVALQTPPRITGGARIAVSGLVEDAAGVPLPS